MPAYDVRNGKTIWRAPLYRAKSFASVMTLEAILHAATRPNEGKAGSRDVGLCGRSQLAIVSMPDGSDPGEPPP
jgi:hypothetical protein